MFYGILKFSTLKLKVRTSVIGLSLAVSDILYSLALQRGNRAVAPSRVKTFHTFHLLCFACVFRTKL